ncbi:group I intron-associated PD-(D/E)XK endonuclease [Neolewinella sp.]|uniref:group I intron-associated PD-(D/E)XK endonuclease n=1 Tax=Neolewinella sp. TaxID=2993543 RepID=UPI003B51F72A
MLTKQRGDIAEQAVVLEALKRGWGVCRPIGDYLPYDLVLDIDQSLYRIQVKYAWYDQAKKNYVVDVRRTKTNRRQMVRSNYLPEDFDFAVLYIEATHNFYVMPAKVFISYGSEIHLVEDDKRQRKPRSAVYRNAWQLIGND